MKCEISFENIEKKYKLKKEVDAIINLLDLNAKQISNLPNIGNYLKYFLVTPSKRKRLIKLISTGKICGDIDEDSRKIIMALELVNSTIFLHDDVIDHDSFRKGKPTLNKLIGDEKTILIGNMLFSLAIEELSKLNCPSKIKKGIISDFSHSLFLENAGQYTDVYFRNNFSFKNLDDWEKMVLRHSASYVVSSLKAIAKLKNRVDIANAIEIYENNCALAGAAEDALMGFIGKKKAKGDIKNKGFTILVYYALKDKKGLKDISSEDLEELIKSSQAIKKTKEYIQSKVNLALESVKNFPNSYEKDVLIFLAKEMVEELKDVP